MRSKQLNYMHLPIPMSIPPKTMIIHKSAQREFLPAVDILRTGGHVCTFGVWPASKKKSATGMSSPPNGQVTSFFPPHNVCVAGGSSCSQESVTGLRLFKQKEHLSSKT